MNIPATAALAACLCLAVVPPAKAAQSASLDLIEHSISSIAARHMVDACLDLAASRGWKMQVAIVDRSGALVAFGRSDNAATGSQDISLAKARTSARFAWSTDQFAQYAWSTDGSSPGPLAFAPATIGVAGGLPIFTAAGDHIGGIGVSGSMPVNDAECAKAAIEKAGARYSFP